MKEWDMRIDGDTILCRAGFSADSRSPLLSHSLYNVKIIVDSLVKKFPGTCKIYLSPSDKALNWRYQVTDSYKSNRSIKCRKGCKSKMVPCKEVQQSESRYFNAFECPECGSVVPDGKPVHYQAIREYLISKHGAEAVLWGEADDWLGVDPVKNTVVVSNDKDLLMLPAYHYRLSSDKLIRTSDPGQLWLSEDRKKILGGGFKWFCCQMLMGDAVDGIKKLHKGYGPVKVYDIMSGKMSAACMWKIVEDHYASDKDQLLVNAKLLWISRKPQQMFSFELLSELLEEIDGDNINEREFVAGDQGS